MKHIGRRGRRTGLMVRIARERISHLFSLAEREAGGGHGELADRYVTLARRIGMRYNVRLISEYRDLYCRRCSTFWVEGRTVRTRFRAGRRVRTCLKCGRQRRVRVKRGIQGGAGAPWGSSPGARRSEGALAIALPGEDGSDTTDEESEEE
jgi:ribonuclease P protein subunit RPR2